MSILGLRSTSDFTVDGQRPKNWREGILKLYPNGKAPLTALTAAMKSRSVDDPEFNWYEREVTNRRFALAASITTGSTTFTFDSTRDVKELNRGIILRSEQTDELVRVNQDPTNATQVSVTRGYASTTATAITYNGLAVNPYWVVVGSAFEEGSLPPSGVQLDPSKVYNYTQIFRQTLENTRTAQKTRLRTGDLVKQAKADCLELTSMDMERAFLFGKRIETTENGKPLRMMNGIINMIDTNNVITASSTTSLATFEDYVEQAFRYGSSEKVCFCGNQFALVLQRIIRKNTSMQIMSGIKEYGMNVMRMITPFGELVLKTHPMFNMSGNGYNSSAGLGVGTSASRKFLGMTSWGLILDMKELQYVYLKESDLQYQQHLEANGLDGDKSGYLAECSLELHFPKSHMLIKGLTAAAVDS